MKRINSGIYKITNLITFDFYIGSAVLLEKRRRDHFIFLRHNNHPNIHLQRASNKYNVKNFKFTILEVVEDKTKLIEREQHYIDTLKPHYNIAKVAGSMLGFKLSLEQRQKKSINNKQKRKILQFSIGGNKIAEYHSLNEAIRQTKCFAISLVLKGKANHAGGYRWIYEDNYLKNNYQLPILKLKQTGKFKKLQLLKPVIQLDLEGNFIKEFESITQANFITKVDRSSIGQVCSGKAKLAGGYKWIYEIDCEKLK